MLKNLMVWFINARMNQPATITAPAKPKKTLFVKTYGCQMNVYDSHKMADVMAGIGYELVDEYTHADMTIINTCHIREKATDKLYCELGRIEKSNRKNDNTQMIIAVTGCVAQAEGEEIMKRAPYVDMVVGPQSYHELPKLIANAARSRGESLELDFAPEDKFDALPEESAAQGSSAFLTVQEGCDKFCTFCVVPYTRGAEYSRNFEGVIEEAKRIAGQGALEINLLGQNVNAYHGLKSDGTTASLADLAYELARIDGVQRIRYTTSHPRDMQDDLIAAHGEIPKLMPFLHLPVQHGSNKVLKEMNRQHDRELYFDIIDRLRKSREDMTFSSDFIVGFPGEDDKDFEDLLDLVERVNYAQCYSFKYSPRPGTPGALREDIVPEEVKTERLQRLQTLLSKQQGEFNQSCIGKTLPVLLDRKGKFEGQLLGKSEFMQSVHLSTSLENFGNLVDVKITSATQTSLGGEIMA